MILAVATAALAVSYQLSLHRSAAEIAPNQLLGMKRLVMVEGNAAIESVRSSHTGTIQYVEDVAIVHYGTREHGVTLWVTIYPDKTTASSECKKWQTLCMDLKRAGSVWRRRI